MPDLAIPSLTSPPPPDAFGLRWSDVGEKRTSNGMRHLYEARSTAAFDAAWTGSRRSQLREMGYASKKGDLGWMAQFWAKPSAAEEASRAAAVAQAVEASRAMDADMVIPAPEGRVYLPYQRAGIAYAMARPATLIGDEMGLGKTIQAVGVLNAGHAKRVLIACPASLKLNWKRELASWMVEQLPVHVVDGGKNAFPQVGEAGVVVINYDVMHSYQDAIRAVSWDLLVCDEAHMLKSKTARRTKAVFGAVETKTAPVVAPIAATRKLLLTGTPMSNRPSELHPLLAFLDKAAWGNFFPYAKRYCAAHQTRFGWDFDGSSNLDELQERLRASVMVRRLKADVLAELPPKRRQVVPLEANTAALKRLLRDEEAAHEAWENLKSAGGASASAAFAELSKARESVGLAKAPLVAEHVLRDEGPVVLFAHHKSVIVALVAALGEAGRTVVTVTGDMAGPERQASVDAFQQGRADVIVGTFGAMGVGHTLTRSAHVVSGEMVWVPAELSQAEDRCHRIGQHGSVHVEHLVFEASLDARLVEVVVEKQRVLDAALDAVPVPVDAIPAIQGTEDAPATAPDMQDLAPTITAEDDLSVLREIEAEAAVPRVPEWQVRQAAAEAEKARIRAVDEAARERLRDAVARHGALLRPDRLQRVEELLSLAEWTGTSSLHARDLVYACEAAGQAEAAAAALREIESEAATEATARAERKARAEADEATRAAARAAADVEVREGLRTALAAAGWGLNADDHATATRLAGDGVWGYGDRTAAQVFVGRMQGYVERAAERVGAAVVEDEDLAMVADPEVREVILGGCRHLSSLDSDRATEDNGIGWSPTTSWTGHWIAGHSVLDERAAAVGLGLLRHHRGQLSDDVQARLFGEVRRAVRPRRGEDLVTRARVHRAAPVVEVFAVEPEAFPVEDLPPLDSPPSDAVPVPEVPEFVAAPEPEVQVVEEPEPVEEVEPAQSVTKAPKIESAENVAARARLTAVGEAMYGPRWMTDLARDLGVNDRTMRRYESGATPIPADLWSRVAAVALRRRDALDAILNGFGPP